jgi:hypothetical protein
MNNSLELLKVQTAVAMYDNPWLEAADEAGSGFGKILKFVKGDWQVGDDNVPEGTEFIVYIDEVARGYVKFADKKVVERHIVKVRDGKPPSREESRRHRSRSVGGGREDRPASRSVRAAMVAAYGTSRGRRRSDGVLRQQ